MILLVLDNWYILFYIEQHELMSGNLDLSHQVSARPVYINKKN